MCLLICKGGIRPHAQQYESKECVDLKSKGNPEEFRGYCYNCGKFGHMDRKCPEPSKEEGGKSGKAGEDAHIQLNLAEKDTYSYVEFLIYSR